MRKTVVAATHREFMDWCRQNEVSPQSCRYAARPEDLRGVRLADLVLAPGWDRLGSPMRPKTRIDMIREIQRIRALG